jgi:hypothetical protein
LCKHCFINLFPVIGFLISKTARLNIMHDYLLMLSRRRLDTSQHTWSPGQLDHLIEGSLKIANSFDIPNQKFVELISNPVPEWYTNLRDVSSSDTTLCKETSALRSLALLNQGELLQVFFMFAVQSIVFLGPVV